MICKKCGTKIIHTGRILSRSYRHLFKNDCGNLITAKTYKKCNNPYPKNIEVFE